MTNGHGKFIWYELMTRDPDAAKTFYGDVVGWTMSERAPGDMDYRMIDAGDGYVGGVFPLTDEMRENGAHPVWLGYVAVDDVDATIVKLEGLGGSVLMPAKDIPGIGRIAMVADPRGAPFYVMRPMGESGGSVAFKPMANGHCGWNELTTPDQSGALAFYGQLFGWTSTEAMPMCDAGDYAFLDHDGQRIGAVSPYMGDREAPIWTYYFRVADIDAAKSKAEARGGKILFGPIEVPGGDYIVLGADPDGAGFALVGARRK